MSTRSPLLDMYKDFFDIAMIGISVPGQRSKETLPLVDMDSESLVIVSDAIWSDIVGLFISHGADLNFVDSKKNNLFHFSASNRRKGIHKLLWNSVSEPEKMIFQINQNGVTPIQLACILSNVAFVRLLIEKLPSEDLVSHVGPKQLNLIDYVALGKIPGCKRARKVEDLLIQIGVDPYRKDPNNKVQTCQAYLDECGSSRTSELSEVSGQSIEDMVSSQRHVEESAEQQRSGVLEKQEFSVSGRTAPVLLDSLAAWTLQNKELLHFSHELNESTETEEYVGDSHSAIDENTHSFKKTEMSIYNGNERLNPLWMANKFDNLCSKNSEPIQSELSSNAVPIAIAGQSVDRLVDTSQCFEITDQVSKQKETLIALPHQANTHKPDSDGLLHLNCTKFREVREEPKLLTLMNEDLAATSQKEKGSPSKKSPLPFKTKPRRLDSDSHIPESIHLNKQELCKNDRLKRAKSERNLLSRTTLPSPETSSDAISRFRGHSSLADDSQLSSNLCFNRYGDSLPDWSPAWSRCLESTGDKITSGESRDHKNARFLGTASIGKMKSNSAMDTDYEFDPRGRFAKKDAHFLPQEVECSANLSSSPTVSENSDGNLTSSWSSEADSDPEISSGELSIEAFDEKSPSPLHHTPKGVEETQNLPKSLPLSPNNFSPVDNFSHHRIPSLSNEDLESFGYNTSSLQHSGQGEQNAAILLSLSISGSNWNKGQTATDRSKQSPVVSSDNQKYQTMQSHLGESDDYSAKKDFSFNKTHEETDSFLCSSETPLRDLPRNSDCNVQDQQPPLKLTRHEYKTARNSSVDEECEPPPFKNSIDGLFKTSSAVRDHSAESCCTDEEITHTTSAIHKLVNKENGDAASNGGPTCKSANLGKRSSDCINTVAHTRRGSEHVDNVGCYRCRVLHTLGSSSAHVHQEDPHLSQVTNESSSTADDESGTIDNSNFAAKRKLEENLCSFPSKSNLTEIHTNCGIDSNTASQADKSTSRNAMSSNVDISKIGDINGHQDNINSSIENPSFIVAPKYHNTDNTTTYNICADKNNHSHFDNTSVDNEVLGKSSDPNGNTTEYHDDNVDVFKQIINTSDYLSKTSLSSDQDLKQSTFPSYFESVLHLNLDRMDHSTPLVHSTLLSQSDTSKPNKPTHLSHSYLSDSQLSNIRPDHQCLSSPGVKYSNCQILDHFIHIKNFNENTEQFQKRISSMRLQLATYQPDQSHPDTMPNLLDIADAKDKRNSRHPDHSLYLDLAEHSNLDYSSTLKKLSSLLNLAILLLLIGLTLCLPEGRPWKPS